MKQTIQSILKEKRYQYIFENSVVFILCGIFMLRMGNSIPFNSGGFGLGIILSSIIVNILLSSYSIALLNNKKQVAELELKFSKNKSLSGISNMGLLCELLFLCFSK